MRESYCVRILNVAPERSFDVTQSDQPWRRLAEELPARRVELDPRFKTLAQFGRATGVNYKTLQRIEAGKPHRFTTGTLLELDRAYQYAPGSLQRMLDGRDPLPQAAGEDATTGRIEGGAHLAAGEALDWEPGPDGYVLYTLTRDDPWARAGRPFPRSDTLEFVVRALRALINAD